MLLTTEAQIETKPMTASTIICTMGLEVPNGESFIVFPGATMHLSRKKAL